MEWNAYYASLNYPVCGTLYEWRCIKRFSPGYGFYRAVTPDQALCGAIQLIEGAQIEAMYFTRTYLGLIELNFIAFR